MRHTIRPRALAVVAAGLVATAVPVPTATADQQFGGYATEASATPLRIEVYEPVIPIPAQPQAELELAYTTVQAASGPTSKGLATWVWPGDSVGQGWKTFLEAFGFPEEVAQGGYPVQVRAEHPGGPERDSDEPVPGSQMRAGADARETRAVVGYSPDGRVTDEQGEGEAPQPEQPEDPVEEMSSLGAAITGKNRAAAEEEPDEPGLPPELAALVDVDGMASDSRTLTGGDTIRSTATSRLSDVSLLGGLVTADSIVVTTTGTSDGERARATGISRVTGLRVAGTRVTVGPDGVHAAGKTVPVAGLPDNPAELLEQLGISIVAPKGRRSTAQGSGEAEFEGLRIVVDTGPLRSQLDDIPFDDLLGAIPDEEGIRELKSVLGAATQLAPRFVITAGKTAASADTVPEIAFDLPTVDPQDLEGASGPPPVGGTGTGAVSGPTGTAAPPAGSGAGQAAVAEPTALAAGSPGLPPLGSIPGALMVGALVIASGVGWWLSKIGGFVLGGAGSCVHGLESGVPDLRKA